jgi:hypothetical protein
MKRVRKHRKDHNNGKNGWIGGNPRYDRRDPLTAKSMRAGVRMRGRYRGED